MNLCVAYGHVEAFHYPLGFAMDEAHFIQERESSRMITEAELVRQAVAGLLIKESRKQFSKLVKQLNVEARPAASYFGNPSLTAAQQEGPRRKRTLDGARLPTRVREEKGDAHGSS